MGFIAQKAGVVELVDTQDLGSCDASREGSSPFTRTKDHPRGKKILARRAKQRSLAPWQEKV